jgi:hypothetical protein
VERRHDEVTKLNKGSGGRGGGKENTEKSG